MHFETVLKHLIKLLKQEKITYAVTGGASLSLHGVAPTIFDLDLLIDINGTDIIHHQMEKYKYECLARNHSAACYKSKNPVLGRINFIFAIDKIVKDILKRRIRKKLSERIGFIYILNIKDIKRLGKLVPSRKDIQNAFTAADQLAIQYPKLTFLQYIHFLDSYQKVFGQFPVSREKIVFHKPKI